jgi:hypothetical protein
MRLQEMIYNGDWSNVDGNINPYLDAAIEFDRNRVAITGKEPMFITRQDVLDYMTAHPTKSVKCGTNWYSEIRDGEAEEKYYAEKKVARNAEPLVECSCGHSVPKIQVMHASRGTACPDCYDRMSD